ncbi:unnamed protein product [Sphagnum compactum]
MRSCITSLSSMAPRLPCCCSSASSPTPSLMSRALHSLPEGSPAADHSSYAPTPVFPEFLEIKALVFTDAELKQQQVPESSVQGGRGGGGGGEVEEVKGSSYGACEELDLGRVEEGDGGGGEGGGEDGSGDVSEEVEGGKVWRKRWRGEGEASTRRSLRSERRKERAKAYEERWKRRWDASSRERRWGGWQQTTSSQQLGGWVYPEPNAVLETMGSGARSESKKGDFGGWEEQRSEATELGGWLYPDSQFYNSFWQRGGDGKIEIEVLGKKVLVTIAASAAAVENWLHAHGGESKYGLDIEWRPTFQRGDYHAAALLQLSLEKVCLLIQLRFIEVLPASLQRLLADPNIMLGGVSIKADTNKLKKDHGLVCAGEVELTTLAVLKLKVEALRKAGISSLTETVLGFPHKKDKKATMSNWETRELTLQQIQYAAADAWLSYTILIALLAIKEQPTIHRVSMPVDPSDAQPSMAVFQQASTVPGA